MLNASYFRDQLPQDVSAAGASAVVEVRMLSGQMHRVRAVTSVSDGYATLECYDLRAAESAWKERWQEQVLGGPAPHGVERVLVPYESIQDVIITVGRATSTPRIGFGSAGG